MYKNAILAYGALVDAAVVLNELGENFGKGF